VRLPAEDPSVPIRSARSPRPVVLIAVVAFGMGACGSAANAPTPLAETTSPPASVAPASPATASPSALPSATPRASTPASAAPSSSASPAAAAWARVRPRGAGFTVELPGEPTYQSQSIATSVGSVELQIGLVATPSGAYVLGWSEYPVDISDVEASLAGARDGAVKNVSGTLVDDAPVTREGLPGRAFSATVPGGTYRAEVFLQGRRLYQLAVVASTGAEDDFDPDRYFASFRLAG
jgi:hypothetical protein